MMQRSFKIVLMLAAVAMVLTACTGTKVVSQWKDDVYAGHPTKVFVICVLDEWGPRTLVEDEFVRQLKAHGTDAEASYAQFPRGPRPKRDALLDKARELRTDAILVLRFLRKEAGDTHTPLRRYGVPVGFATSWDSYLGTGVSTDMGIRDVSYDYDVISAENTLYRTSTGEPIWSGLTETTYQGGALRQIKPFAQKIVSALAREGIIK